MRSVLVVVIVVDGTTFSPAMMFLSFLVLSVRDYEPRGVPPPFSASTLLRFSNREYLPRATAFEKIPEQTGLLLFRQRGQKWLVIFCETIVAFPAALPRLFKPPGLHSFE